MLAEAAAAVGADAGRRRSVMLVAILLLGLVAPGPLPSAAAVADLLQVALPVADQGAEARRRAEREGLARVLTRISGTEEVLGDDVVRAALRNPGRYYASSGYDRRRVDAAEGEIERPWLLRLEFDRDSILRLLEEAGAPIWTGRRPEVLVWIAREDASGRIELIGADDPLGEAMAARAEHRGLPLVLPLLDLQDRLALSPRDVWAGFEGPLAAASARYGSQTPIRLRLHALDEGGWMGRWDGELAGARIEGRRQVADPADAGVALVDDLADRLAARYAVRRDGGGAVLWLQVDDIDGVRRYAGLMRYLDQLDAVAAVQLVQVREASLLLRIDGIGTGERLLDLLGLEQRLVPASSPERVGGVAVWRARWRG